MLTQVWLWWSARWNHVRQSARRSLVLLTTVMVMAVAIAACGDRTPAMTPPVNRPTPPPTKVLTPEKPAAAPATLTITEVSPPPVIQVLQADLESYQPQVAILSPKPDEVLVDDTVAVRFQVKDLPIFQDPKLGMGPHLEVILDNQPYTMIYDLTQPLVLKDLNAGTHTLRVFASRPWHESFKNEGAYAQATFHVGAKTQTNTPDPKLPLLTYSRPTGSYGAEPIMLDFYLTNAPLHLVAQETTEDEIPDWRIRATVNGQSFVFDRWQPIYLKGFQQGKNWVKLEFLDETGEPLQNEFNTTARLITYEPGGTDGFSQLVRGDISVAEARRILDPNYTPTAAVPSPEPAAAPIPSSPAPATPTPVATPAPAKASPVSVPVKPAPVKAAPVKTAPVEPMPVKSAPVEPAPVEPAPVNEAAQSLTKPVPPEPVQPEVATPEVTEPTAVQPKAVSAEPERPSTIVAPIVPSTAPTPTPSSLLQATPAPKVIPESPPSPAPVASSTPDSPVLSAPAQAVPAPSTVIAEPDMQPEPIAPSPAPSLAPEASTPAALPAD